jgi:hypothetical protein
MNGEITVHKQVGASLKLFLDELGYKSVWELVDEDHDKLIVLKDGDTKFIKAVFRELETSGFIPYHYSVQPKVKGRVTKRFKEDEPNKLEFTATVMSKQIFRNVSGDFMLVLFQSEDDNNYLWKSYKLDREVEVGDTHRVFARLVAPLTGLNKEKITLINYVRLKENLNEDSTS